MAPGVPVTSLFAGLAGLYFIELTRRVIAWRGKLKVGLGDGSQKQLVKNGSSGEEYDATYGTGSGEQQLPCEPLQVAIRCQGNFIECTPLTFILLGAAEASDVLPRAVLITVGGVFLIGRVLHAEFGMKGRATLGWGRVPGMAITLTSVGVLAFASIYGGLRDLL